MIRKIIIATEGTAIMQNAIEYVATLFPKATYYIVSVVDTSIGSVHVSHALTNLLEERTKKALEKAEMIFKRRGMSVETKALRGDPAREIMKLAQVRNADLVVLGTSTKSGVVKFTFGHVGEVLIKNMKRSLLLINQKIEIKKPEKILSPTDGGVHSKEAGQVALFLAQCFKGVLYKYYVGGDQETGKRVLNAAEAWAKEIGIREVNKLAITSGEPAEEIIKLAPEFDVIVIGKGKRKFLKKDILGITSREVAALSPIPIFLVGK